MENLKMMVAQIREHAKYMIKESGKRDKKLIEPVNTYLQGVRFTVLYLCSLDPFEMQKAVQQLNAEFRVLESINKQFYNKSNGKEGLN